MRAHCCCCAPAANPNTLNPIHILLMSIAHPMTPPPGWPALNARPCPLIHTAPHLHTCMPAMGPNVLQSRMSDGCSSSFSDGAWLVSCGQRQIPLLHMHTWCLHAQDAAFYAACHACMQCACDIRAVRICTCVHEQHACLRCWCESAAIDTLLACNHAPMTVPSMACKWLINQRPLQAAATQQAGISKRAGPRPLGYVPPRPCTC